MRGMVGIGDLRFAVVILLLWATAGDAISSKLSGLHGDDPGVVSDLQPKEPLFDVSQVSKTIAMANGFELGMHQDSGNHQGNHVRIPRHAVSVARHGAQAPRHAASEARHSVARHSVARHGVARHGVQAPRHAVSVARHGVQAPRHAASDAHHGVAPQNGNRRRPQVASHYDDRHTSHPYSPSSRHRDPRQPVTYPIAVKGRDGVREKTRNAVSKILADIYKMDDYTRNGAPYAPIPNVPRYGYHGNTQGQHYRNLQGAFPVSPSPAAYQTMHSKRGASVPTVAMPTVAIPPMALTLLRDAWRLSLLRQVAQQYLRQLSSKPVATAKAPATGYRSSLAMQPSYQMMARQAPSPYGVVAPTMAPVSAHMTSYSESSDSDLCPMNLLMMGFCGDKYAGLYGHPMTSACFVQCDHMGKTFLRACAPGTSWKAMGVEPATFNYCS